MESRFWQKLIILKHLPGFVSSLKRIVWVDLLLCDVVWLGARILWRYSTSLMMAFSEPRTTWALVTILGPEQTWDRAESRSMIDARSPAQPYACPPLAFVAATHSNPNADIHMSTLMTHDTLGMHFDALWVSKCVQRSEFCLLNLRRLKANGCQWNKNGLYIDILYRQIDIKQSCTVVQMFWILLL